MNTKQNGGAVASEAVTATFRSPVDGRGDHAVKSQPSGQGVLAAQHAPQDGARIVEVDAEAGLPHPCGETRRILVRNGNVE